MNPYDITDTAAITGSTVILQLEQGGLIFWDCISGRAQIVPKTVDGELIDFTELFDVEGLRFLTAGKLLEDLPAFEA